ncbi:MAG TPA: NAD-dependent epimerase/dehydratase family protein [Kofleriaceae bacterium]|nr:NAD-dependent epimerase/dehydratase family protein [Kofleriaceae bacterium]
MTAPVVVTGATGFLGEHLCAELVGRGVPVRALARTRSDYLADMGVDVIRGDVLWPADLDRALPGARAVFHLAGLVSRDPDDATRMMRLHVDGTRSVVEAMARHKVPRLVLASTSGTVAVSKDEVILDETAGSSLELVAGWPYYASKIYQERLAFELGRARGLTVLAVNPSLLLGPGDRRLSSTGDVLRFLRGQIPTVPGGGVNFVDARDVAAATAAALDRGRDGERYLMGGPNWTTAEFFGRLERVAKVRGPWLKLSPRLSRWGAAAIEQVYRWRGKEAPVDPVSVDMAEHYWWFDSGKAAAELGFVARDPQLTLHDTVRYLRQGIARDL